MNFNFFIYLELFPSVCGYNNQYSFENFGDEDVKFVENFARTELVQLLSDHCSKIQTTLNENVIKNFFGSYVFQPQNFEIEHEESENLKAVSVVVSEQNGIQLETFEIDDISKK